MMFFFWFFKINSSLHNINFYLKIIKMIKILFLIKIYFCFEKSFYINENSIYKFDIDKIIN